MSSPSRQQKQLRRFRLNKDEGRKKKKTLFFHSDSLPEKNKEKGREREKQSFSLSLSLTIPTSLECRKDFKREKKRGKE